MVVERTAATGARSMVAVNVTGDETSIELPEGWWVRPDGEVTAGRLPLGPWDVAWLRRRR